MLEWLFSVVSKLQWVRLSSNDRFVPPSLDKNDLFSRRDSFLSVQQSQVKKLNAFSWRRWIPALDSVVAVLASAECNWTQVIIVFICGACNGVGYDNHFKKMVFRNTFIHNIFCFNMKWRQLERTNGDPKTWFRRSTKHNRIQFVDWKVDSFPISYGFIFLSKERELLENYLKIGLKVETWELWKSESSSARIDTGACALLSDGAMSASWAWLCLVMRLWLNVCGWVYKGWGLTKGFVGLWGMFEDTTGLAVVCLSKSGLADKLWRFCWVICSRNLKHGLHLSHISSMLLEKPSKPPALLMIIQAIRTCL